LSSIEITQILTYGPTAVLLALLLATILKLAPTWKEVRLRELDIRAGESAIREKEAEALGRLAEVLQSIAVEQRRATETIEILQRVNADASDSLSGNVRLLTDRIASIEDSGGTTLAHVAVDIHKLTERVMAIEKSKNVETERTATTA